MTGVQTCALPISHNASATLESFSSCSKQLGRGIESKEDTLDVSSSPVSDTCDFGSCFIGQHQSHDPN